MHGVLASFAAFTALALAAMSLGGALYESLLVDRIWPANIHLIQPAQGGLNQKLFWMPMPFHCNGQPSPYACLVRYRFIPPRTRVRTSEPNHAGYAGESKEMGAAEHSRVPLDFATLLALCAAVIALLISR